MLSLSILQLLLPALTAALVVVPQPSGPYAVSLTDVQFVDSSRTDPYSNAPQRKIPISIFTPVGSSSACSQPVQQMYMPAATAKFWEQDLGTTYNGTFDNTLSQVALSLCQSASSTRLRRRANQYPLIVFAPGLGLSRQLYNILCSNLAAQGFTVVNIDTPGQAKFITYPDGSTQTGANITTAAQVNTAIDIRVQDIEFILNSLSTRNIDASSAAIFGHSLGGATALAAIIADHGRFIGGANFDGGFFGAPLTHTTDRPFLIFASDQPGAMQHNQSTVPSWAAVWQNLLGPKWQLQLKNSTHPTFEDLPTLANLFGLYSNPRTKVALGSVDPQVALKVKVAELGALAGFLYGRNSVQSVVQVAKGFKDVAVVNATNVG